MRPIYTHTRDAKNIHSPSSSPFLSKAQALLLMLRKRRSWWQWSSYSLNMVRTRRTAGVLTEKNIIMATPFSAQLKQHCRCSRQRHGSEPSGNSVKLNTNLLTAVSEERRYSVNIIALLSNGRGNTRNVYTVQLYYGIDNTDVRTEFMRRTFLIHLIIKFVLLLLCKCECNFCIVGEFYMIGVSHSFNLLTMAQENLDERNPGAPFSVTLSVVWGALSCWRGNNVDGRSFLGKRFPPAKPFNFSDRLRVQTRTVQKHGVNSHRN